MDNKSATLAVARRVAIAMCATASDVHSVARAADITTSELEDRLNGRVEFQLDELVRVGGFLRIPVTRFVEVAA